jgi:hypothetical protein
MGGVFPPPFFLIINKTIVMLKVNGKEVVLSDKSCPYAKRVNESIAKLYKMNQGQIRLKYTERHKRYDPEDRRRVEYATAVRFQTEATLIVEGETEHWMWYQTARPLSNGAIEYKPTAYRFTGNELFMEGKSDKTLLYFMVFISPLCQKVGSLKDIQNPEQKAASWFVELPEEEAMERAELQKLTGVIFQKVYGGNTEDLVLWAKAMGIHGADRMQEMTLKTTLAQIATVDKRSMTLFLEDISVKADLSEFKAAVTDFIETGTIALDGRGKGKQVWKMREDGKLSKVIVQVEPGEDPNLVIQRYVIENPRAYDRLKELCKAIKNQS